MFEGCHRQPSQRELANKTKSWPDKKMKISINFLTTMFAGQRNGIKAKKAYA